MCAVFISMGEVSSCEATVREGQHVESGEKIGMFHYGDSSYALLFDGGGKVELVDEATDLGGGRNVPVKATLATVVR